MQLMSLLLHILFKTNAEIQFCLIEGQGVALN